MTLRVRYDIEYWRRGLWIGGEMLSKAWSLSKVGMEEWFLICIAEGILVYGGNPREYVDEWWGLRVLLLMVLLTLMMDVLHDTGEGIYVLVMECWVKLDHYIWDEIIVLVGHISLFCGPYGVKKDGSTH